MSITLLNLDSKTTDGKRMYANKTEGMRGFYAFSDDLRELIPLKYGDSRYHVDPNPDHTIPASEVELIIKHVSGIAMQTKKANPDGLVTCNYGFGRECVYADAVFHNGRLVGYRIEKYLLTGLVATKVFYPLGELPETIMTDKDGNPKTKNDYVVRERYPNEFGKHIN